MSEASKRRKKALAKGSKKYLGAECKHHPGQREKYASNGSCVDCVQREAAKWRKNNSAKLLEKKNQWNKDNPIKYMLQGARRRAKKSALPFSLKFGDISMQEECPVLGIKFEMTGHIDNSPSLDRVRPELGYVPGNVKVISHKANRIKSNATLEELQKVIKYYAENYR